nr:MAG TPA: hypothetical protein [Crassvirales sp.]
MYPLLSLFRIHSILAIDSQFRYFLFGYFHIRTFSTFTV